MGGSGVEVWLRPTSAPFTAETLNYGQMNDCSMRGFCARTLRSDSKLLPRSPVQITTAASRGLFTSGLCSLRIELGATSPIEREAHGIRLWDVTEGIAVVLFGLDLVVVSLAFASMADRSGVYVSSCCCHNLKP